jgi:hypothetical protein
MSVKEFIEDNFDYNTLLMKSYQTLNEINIPTKIKRFPYNLLHLQVKPTYKTISMEYIKGKTFYEKKGGFHDEILVFLY